MKNQKYLWDYFEKSKLEGSIFIISCGDRIRAICPFWLHLHRLRFSMSMETMTINTKRSTGGCICIDDKLVVYEGVRILGLGGSCAINLVPSVYRMGNAQKRVLKLFPKIWFRGGIDILVTHALLIQLNDGRDLPHQGFKVFRRLMEKYRPKYFPPRTCSHVIWKKTQAL